MPYILGPKWEEFRTNMWGPQESHGIASDCPNPYCDYNLTQEDLNHAEEFGGHFECPNCGWKSDIGYMLWGEGTRQRTRSGMKLQEMGQLGEDVVKMYANENQGIPGLGAIRWESPNYNDPIDMVAGDYGLEVKSLHSESIPRFKIAADPASGMSRSYAIKKKMERLGELSKHLGSQLYPGLLGVRLNFYTNRADFFFAPEYKDRIMTAMQVVGYTDFSKLNPFKQPHEFATANLPTQGETTSDQDIPF